MTDATAVSFGWKNAWLAIAADDPHRAIDALGVRGASAISWSDGLERAYGSHSSRDVFITPSIEGWVLVVGPAISELGADSIVELSKKLDTQVCRFSTHRVVGHDAWIRADRGRLVRAYEYTNGRIVEERGEISAEEIEYGLADGAPEQETTVFALADDWSIDPSTLDERGQVGVGWLGAI
jgi:hypothetical protein